MKLTEKNILGTNWTHGEHSEDFLLLGEEACEFMIDGLEDAINNEKESHSLTTIKIDGAPSVICASNFKGKCFVAKKGLFNKDPQYATTPEECDKYWGVKSPDLAHKMKVLLKWLPLIKIPTDEMWQGDFLFTYDDLKKKTVDGEECVTFHPNTILYAVPLDDPKSTRILRAEAGVCWHTRYYLDNEGNRKRSFKIDLSRLQSIPAVFMQDANIPDYSGKVALDPEEVVDAEIHLNEIKRLLPSLLNDPYYPSLIEDDMKNFLNKFRNSRIRENKDQHLYEKDFDDLIQQENDIYAKKSYKREIYKINAKRDHEAKVNALNTYKPTIILLWTIQNHIIDIKESLLGKLNKLNPWKAYLMYKDGSYRPTNGEGFVVSDIDGNAQKWVSRSEFSNANFSPDVIKGWDNPSSKVNESVEHFMRRIKEEMMDEIQAELDPIFNDVNVENKKDVKRRSKPKGAEYTLMPGPGSSSKEDRNDKANNVLGELEARPEIFENPKLTLGGQNNRTPIITANIDTSNVENASIFLNFKPSATASHGDALDTEADEVYWAYCMSLCNSNQFDLLPNEETDLDEFDLTKFGLKPFQHPKNNNKIGYNEGSKLLMESPYFDVDDYIFSRESMNFVNGSFFYDKKSAHNTINSCVSKVMKSVGVSSKKDAWNPADVVACRKSYFENEFFNDWNEVSSRPSNPLDGENGFSQYNAYLKDQLKKKNIICISLKDITQKGAQPHLIDQNINEENPIEYQFNDCSIKEIRIPVLLLRSEATNKFKKAAKYVGISLQVENRYDNIEEVIDLEYRIFSGRSLNAEAKKNGSSARFGKVPKFIIANMFKEYSNGNIYLPKEREEAEVENIIFHTPEIMLPEIKTINENLILRYPQDSSEYTLNETSWMLFCKKLQMNGYEQLLHDDQLATQTLGKNITDIPALYIWPRIIDFLYIIASNKDNIQDILKKMLQGSSKTYPGCAPFVKLY